MKAIGYEKAGPISAPNSLVEFEAPDPQVGPHDLLVEVRGVSVNPVDSKVRTNVAPEAGARILGFDAAGVVQAVGSSVAKFQPGDAVYYSGDLTRPGSNAAMQAVDERIVGTKPTSLGFTEAAGLPLTSITAWELLFESLGVAEGGGEGEALLVIGGAGGVGSILIQLARQLTKLNVVATASRDDTREWVLKMGAHHVINHHQPLDEEMQKLGISPRYVAALTHTDKHIGAVIKLIKPRGRIALIDDPKDFDIAPLKPKALSLNWEFMFTRSMFNTDDIEVQHALLTRVAEMLDAGTLVSTVNKDFGPMTVENLQAAHEFQESGQAIGKSVLSGFD